MNNSISFISSLLNNILLTRRVLAIKPIKNLKNVDNKTIIRPQNIEEKLEEAEKGYEEGRVHSEDEVWAMLSRKYGFDLKIEFTDSTNQCFRTYYILFV